MAYITHFLHLLVNLEITHYSIFSYYALDVYIYAEKKRYFFKCQRYFENTLIYNQDKHRQIVTDIVIFLVLI